MGTWGICSGMVVSMIDKHESCPSYPVCDDNPFGCIVRQGVKNVEWYGHKDKAEWYENNNKPKKRKNNDKNKSK